METDRGLPPREDQPVIIKALIIFRMAAISFFLGTVIVFQLQYTNISVPLAIWGLIAFTYVLSILYLGMLGRVARFVPFLYFQLAADLFIETGIIYYTGGVESPFTFLYILTIFSTVFIMLAGGSYFIASGASILYGLLVVFEFYGMLHPVPLQTGARYVVPQQEFVFFTVLVHIAAFYLVAFLSDFLSRRLKDTLLALVSKSRDLTYLQAFHQNVVANMGSGFIALDMEGRIVSSNQAAEEILGVKAKDYLHRKLDAAFPELAGGGVLPPGSAADRKEWVYGAGAGRKYLAGAVSLFRDAAGEILGVILIFQDITHIRKMEEAVAKSERMAAVGRMAAGLAHEIRNPLGSISGSIQLLKEALPGELRPPHDRLMAIILRETGRLNGIITNFLSYASPTMKTVPGVNLGTLVADEISLFRNDPRYAGKVAVELAVDGEIRLTCDPEGIKQVVWNLMLNAAQALPDGGTVSIGARRAGDGCELSVADNGCGMDDEETKVIFEPFYTTKEGGTGLGLPMVAKIVEAHGGTIVVESAKGKGSTFIVRLPLAPRNG